MSDLDKCTTIKSLIPIIKDLQAKVLDLENAVKIKEQRCSDLEEEVRELQRKIVTPAVQPIKRTITKKSYAETADGPPVPVKSTVRPPVKTLPKSKANPVPKKKSTEEPWKVVRGRGFGRLFNEKLVSPLLIPGKSNVPAKKDFCISGLPVNITDETLRKVIVDVVGCQTYKDGCQESDEDIEKRIRFVSVHKREGNDTRSWTWARIGIDVNLEEWLLEANRWLLNISLRPWTFEDK